MRSTHKGYNIVAYSYILKDLFIYLISTKTNLRDVLKELEEERKIVTNHPKDAYNVAFPDHMWLKFIDKPQSDEVIFFNFSLLCKQIYSNNMRKLIL